MCLHTIILLEEIVELDEARKCIHKTILFNKYMHEIILRALYTENYK